MVNIFTGMQVHGEHVDIIYVFWLRPIAIHIVLILTAFCFIIFNVLYAYTYCITPNYDPES